MDTRHRRHSLFSRLQIPIGNTGRLPQLFLLSLILLVTHLPCPSECSSPSTAQCSASFPPSLFHSHRGPVRVGTCPIPVDDTSTTASYSPWSHQPFCVLSDPKLSKGKPVTKYCVYTNSRHGARGISILTTPEVAADSTIILNEPMNTTAEILARPRNLPTSTSGTTGTPPDDPYTAADLLPFKVIPIPNKGLGVVATRRIARYEQIMVDYASVVVDVAFASVVPAWTGYELLHRMVDQLADPESILGLGRSNDMAADEVENVLRTNAFHTVLGSGGGGGGGPHMAVYPIVSRINHACKPNGYTRFIPQSLSVSVGAARDIEPGEEITISYITVGQTTQERQKTLKTWGFECACALCTSSPAEQAASDARRREIETLRSHAATAYQEGKPYQALRFTRQVLNLIPSEELFPLVSEQYENMARVYWLLGDAENGFKYARMSLEVLAEQGYIDEVRPEHMEVMVESFREGVRGGRERGNGSG